MHRIDIRYFFYYWMEGGANAHPDDVESGELHLLLGYETVTGGTPPVVKTDCIGVWLWEMFGSAHGLSLSTNATDLSRANGWASPGLMPTWALEAEPGCDPTMKPQNPLTCLYKPVMFVEAGKHATAPDLDQDGFMTPIVDLNSSYRDAWAVRDALGTDSRLPNGFASELFVPRDLRDVILPSVIPPLQHPRADKVWSDLHRAEVVASRGEPVCVSEAQFRLITDAWKRGRQRRWYQPKPRGLLSNKGFCADTDIAQSKPLPKLPKVRGNAYLGVDKGNPYKRGFAESVDAAVRLDDGRGWAIVPPFALSPPFVGGWFALRAVGNYWFDTPDVTIPKAVQVLYQSSVTPSFGIYSATGQSWTESWRERAWAWELGLKIRMPPLRGYYPSARIGYAFNGTKAITNQRIVLEFGVGVW